MDALDLLIEDCWKEILLRVNAPEDLKSCSEACLTFQRILKEKKNAFMFCLILPHLLGHFPAPDYDRLQLQLQQWKALLKCRLVCKRWRNSIDELRDAKSRYVFMCLYGFYSGERTERFLQIFANHDGNPFLGRCVRLENRSSLLFAGNQVEGLNVDPGETFYIRKLRQLLERFGNEIWNVDIFEETADEHLAFCKNIHTVLGHLPNLHALRVMSHPNRHNLNVELDQQREMAELTTYIAANPLPALPQLEHLKADVGLNVVMTQSILEKYAPQLKSLLLGDPNPIGFPEQCFRLCNLEKLDLDGLDASTSLHCLRQLRSPLRHLGLGVSNRNDVEVWAIDELFRNIEHLPIQHLFIAIWDVYLGESGPISAEHRPYHGSISSVDLRFQAGSISLNFLSYCPKLEYIFMEQRNRPRHGMPAGHPNGVAESFDVNGLVEQVGYDLYRSNIWENLPSLKSFTHHNCVGGCSSWKLGDYGRVEYEKRKLENGSEVVGE